MTDTHRYWREALAHPHKIGKELAIVEAQPECGYYRMRNQDGGSDIPCAIWLEGDRLVALRGSREADPYPLWTWIARSPVSYEDYTQARETGRWSDDPPVIRHEHKNLNPHPVAERVITKEDNLPTDPVERMKLQLEGEKEQAAIFLKQPITTQEQANQAATWSKRISALYKEADDAFKDEKKPILAAAKACDDKWRWRGEAQDLATKLKRHLDPWLLKQKREEEERQAKARAEAERVRKEAEEKARAAELEAARSSEDAERAKREAEEAAEAAAAAEREAEARRTAAGRTGATVSLRTYVSARITDYDAALKALKDDPEIRALVQKLANRAIKDGHALPGVERVTEQRAA